MCFICIFLANLAYFLFTNQQNRCIIVWIIVRGCWLLNCIKCGKETTREQVFCDDCLLASESYPVNPSTVVLLPQRDPSWDKPPVFEKEKTEADIIRNLRRIIRWLALTIAVLTVLLGLLAGIFINYLSQSQQDPNIGQNYSTFGEEP